MSLTPLRQTVIRELYRINNGITNCVVESPMPNRAVVVRTSSSTVGLQATNYLVRNGLERVGPPRLNGVQRFFATFSLWYQYVAGEIPTTPGSKYKHGYGTFWYRLNGGDW